MSRLVAQLLTEMDGISSRGGKEQRKYEGKEEGERGGEGENLSVGMHCTSQISR